MMDASNTLCAPLSPTTKTASYSGLDHGLVRFLLGKYQPRLKRRWVCVGLSWTWLDWLVWLVCDCDAARRDSYRKI